MQRLLKGLVRQIKAQEIPQKERPPAFSPERVARDKGASILAYQSVIVKPYISRKDNVARSLKPLEYE
jgi:hypothetical protein